MTRRTDGPFVVYEILPGQLFQRGKLHGRPYVNKIDFMDYFGIGWAVALAPTKPDEDLVEQDKLDGTIYTHYPIPDGLFDAESPYLQTLAVELARYIEAGGRVLTMCNAGRNRSGLLSALIVRELTGLPGAAAMAVVREHRPNAIANPHFERFLEELS